MTRLCHTKSIVSVNGQFPGPRIVAREGDQLLIKVVNHVSNNISIHWYWSLLWKMTFCVYYKLNKWSHTLKLMRESLNCKLWWCLWNRHGIRQLRSGWADGPAYLTQCPIQTGQSYVYNFTIVGQRGTLFWHAHISWLRATVYGPIVILPKPGVPYPFAKPYKEVPIIFGNKLWMSWLIKILHLYATWKDLIILLRPIKPLGHKLQESGSMQILKL